MTAWQLKVISGEPMGGVFALKPGTTRVGRSQDSDLVFQSAGVSREQFSIEARKEGLTLVNHSRYGTQIDDDTVLESAPLKPGQRIKFGMYMLLEIQPIDNSAPPSVDDDVTAELPEYYDPSPLAKDLPDANNDSFDSFLMRNDDLLSLGLPVAKPEEVSATPPKPPAEKPRPSPLPPLAEASSMDPLASREGSDLMLSGDGLDSPPSTGALPELLGEGEIIKLDPGNASFDDDSGFFSIAGGPVVGKAPLPGSSKESPAAEEQLLENLGPLLADENHTRGLSPEAIAFMRQQWQKKARMKKMILIGGIIVLLAAGGIIYWVIQ